MNKWKDVPLTVHILHHVSGTIVYTGDLSQKELAEIMQKLAEVSGAELRIYQLSKVVSAE